MSDSIEPRYFTVDQLAGYAGMTVKAIYHLVSKQQLPVIRTGRRLRFDRLKIDQYMENRRC